ncbi:MAG: hypothetical protein SH850_31260 [Planctomycetaceae bacterium]|nr:hypothetical protein [Planctomycetaceae bacterium]
MGNWHVVIPYDERATEWLTSQGFQHPASLPNNRLPTFAEIEEAAKVLGIGPTRLCWWIAWAIIP